MSIVYASGKFPTKRKLQPILGIASLVWDLPAPAAGTVLYDVDIPINNFDDTIGVEGDIDSGVVTVQSVTIFPDGIRLSIEVDTTATVAAKDLTLIIPGANLTLTGFINVIATGGTFQPSSPVTLEVNSAVGGGGGTGDMLAATYDPTGIAADVYDRANETGIEQINGIITAALTGDVDNYTPTGYATANMIRLDPDATNHEISGFPAPAAGVHRIIHWSNTHNTNDIKFMHDASSTAANGLMLRDGMDKAIKGNETASFWYDHLADSGVGRWKVFNRVG